MAQFSDAMMRAPLSMLTIATCCATCAYMHRRRLTYESTGVNYGKVVVEKQHWRILTAAFTHADRYHLALNMARGLVASVKWTGPAWVAGNCGGRKGGRGSEQRCLRARRTAFPCARPPRCHPRHPRAPRIVPRIVVVLLRSHCGSARGWRLRWGASTTSV